MLKDKHLEIVLRYLHPEWDYIDISGDEYEEFAEAIMYLICDYYRNKHYFLKNKSDNEQR